MLRNITLLFALSAASLTAIGQTVSDFETALPGADTSYLETFATDNDYPFTSGNATFIGHIQYGGSYRSGFNYSNRTNDSIGNANNMWSAITAGGYQSSNYGIAYLESDWVDFNKTQEAGIILNGAARNNYVAGFYVTNTTYMYQWVKDNYTTGDYFKLIVRGYNNQTFTDSVVVTLAEFTANDTTLVNTWEWVDLLSLNKVDSVTFQFISSNSMSPYYFAIDNFTTTDGVCPNVSDLAVNDITSTTAKLTWEIAQSSLIQDVEIAIDFSNTDDPDPLSTIITWNAQQEYTANNLEANRQYYAHIRSKCDDGNSDWQKIAFTTSAVSASNLKVAAVDIYPNPTKGPITIGGTEQWSTVQIYNIQGQLLDTKQVMNNSFDMTNLPNNVYLIKLTDGNSNSAQTLITKGQ